MSTADVLAELAYLNPRNKRKGKGGRQPAMDPRLDPNVDPKKAKRILANRLSAARSKMKQKSHVEVILHKQICFWCSVLLCNSCISSLECDCASWPWKPQDIVMDECQNSSALLQWLHVLMLHTLTSVQFCKLSSDVMLCT